MRAPTSSRHVEIQSALKSLALVNVLLLIYHSTPCCWWGGCSSP